MPIKIRLSSILGDKKLKMIEVSRQTGIGTSTLMRFYHERSEGIRFDVLGKLCAFLECQPGDLLVYVPDKEQGELYDQEPGYFATVIRSVDERKNG